MRPMNVRKIVFASVLYDERIGVLLTSERQTVVRAYINREIWPAKKGIIEMP